MNDIQSLPIADPKAIFLKALDCASPEELAAYLNQTCAGNPALRGRVDDLLQAHHDAGRFLGGASFPNATSDAPIAEHPGSVIGPYKLLEQIGEGGMGMVFMAEQTRPVQRRVALKIIKPGMDTRQVIARFEAERQALALMDHPHIARVLDAGATDAGRPYFVMELVRGVPLTEFCDRNNYSIRQRLELFVDVCQAVQHAHQKGIIHRDIKPTNVLVTLHDGKPVIKVIDFGVAKATGQRLTEKTLFTGFSEMIGTPLYMSPEQAELSGLDVDTRSDIYSLGVLLYELLTGHTPFDSQRLKSVAFDELRRIILEEEPLRPSTRISTLAQQAISTVSQRRSCDPRHLSRLCKGELDWIVMKSLEKDRNRRYETASSLAADVEHYLHDEPVQACPPSAIYRFRKFAWRNKVGLAMATVICLASIVAVGSIGWMARDRAARQTILNQQITMALDESKTWYKSHRLTEAMSAVKRAEGLLASGSTNDGLLRQVGQWRDDLEIAQQLEQIRLQGAWADDRKKDFYKNGGMDKAYREAFLRHGIDLATLGVEKSAQCIQQSAVKQEMVDALHEWIMATNTDDPTVKLPSQKMELLQLARLADPDPWRDRLRDAIQHNDDVALMKLAGEKDSVLQSLATESLFARALYLRNHFSEAIEILLQVQKRYPSEFWIYHQLAYSLLHTNPPKHQEAIGFLRAAIALRPDAAVEYNELGANLWNLGKAAEAEAAIRESLRLAPDNAVVHANLGYFLEVSGKHSEAESECREAIRLEPKNAPSYVTLGRVLVSQSKYADAQSAFREAIHLQPDNVNAINEQALLLANCPERQFRDPAQAVELARKAIEVAPKDSGCWFMLGVAQYRSGDFPAAIESLQKAWQLNSDSSGGGPLFLAMAHWQLGRKDEARKWYDQAVQLIEKKAPKNDLLRSFRQEAETLLQLPTAENNTNPTPKSDNQSSEASAPITDTSAPSPQKKK